MELADIQQLEFESVKNEHFDVLIAVSGYEKRCSYLSEHLPLNQFTKLVFAFTEKNKDAYRIENDEFFRKRDFEFIDSSGSTGNEIQKTLESVLNSFEQEKIRILIDYSCMTKEWYATIVNYFVNWDMKLKEVDLVFSYTPSAFEKSKKRSILKRKKHKYPDKQINSQNKPVSLVLGLGYDQDQAFELINRLRPARTFAFYSDPSIDNRFVKEVESRNNEILNSLPPENVYRYPMDDLKKINLILKDLCVDLRLDSQLILAPLGPKPFALSCMLLSARYPDIWIWRLHSDSSDQYYDWHPFGKPLICKAVFRKDDDYS